METKIESVTTVYEDGVIVGLIKRDETTKKSLVYLVREAKVEDIANLINVEKE